MKPSVGVIESLPMSGALTATAEGCMKRATIHVGMFLVLCGLLLAGCAGYTARPVPEPVLAEMPCVHREADGLVVAARPVTDAGQQKALFDENMQAVGVLPVQVLIRNDVPGKTFYVPDGSVALMLGTERIEPSAPNRVAWIFEKEDTDHIDTTAGCVGGCVGGIVGLSMASNANKVGKARKLDFQQKALDEGEILSGQIKCGFLFFRRESGFSAVDRGILRIAVHEAQQKETPYEVVELEIKLR